MILLLLKNLLTFWAFERTIPTIRKVATRIEWSIHAFHYFYVSSFTIRTFDLSQSFPQILENYNLE